MKRAIFLATLMYSSAASGMSGGFPDQSAESSSKVRLVEVASKSQESMDKKLSRQELEEELKKAKKEQQRAGKDVEIYYRLYKSAEEDSESFLASCRDAEYREKCTSKRIDELTEKLSNLEIFKNSAAEYDSSFASEESEDVDNAEYTASFASEESEDIDNAKYDSSFASEESEDIDNAKYDSSFASEESEDIDNAKYDSSFASDNSDESSSSSDSSDESSNSSDSSDESRGSSYISVIIYEPQNADSSNNSSYSSSLDSYDSDETLLGRLNCDSYDSDKTLC